MSSSVQVSPFRRHNNWISDAVTGHLSFPKCTPLYCLLYSYLLSNNTEQHGVLNSSPQHALQSNSNCGWETLNQEVCVGKDANLDLKIDSVFLSFR